MAQNPDIRVVVGTNKVETISTIESDLKEVAAQISGGPNKPLVTVGVDVDASRKLFESQLGEITKGVTTGANTQLNVTPNVNIDTNAILQSLGKVAAAMKNVDTTSSQTTKKLTDERRAEIRQMADESVALIQKISKSYEKLTDLVSNRKISSKSLQNVLDSLSSAYSGAFSWTGNLNTSEKRYFDAYKKTFNSSSDYTKAIDIINSRNAVYTGEFSAGLMNSLSSVKTTTKTSGLLAGIEPVKYIDGASQAIAKEAEVVTTSNAVLDQHSSAMESAIQAEAQKAQQSQATATAVAAETTALNNASNAAKQHAKTIQVTTNQNIDEFERQVIEMARANAQISNYKIESIQAIASTNHETGESTIAGAYMTYRNPENGMLYGARYGLMPVDPDDIEGEQQLVLLQESMIENQKQYNAELERTNNLRDTSVNKLTKQLNADQLKFLDPNAAKTLAGTSFKDTVQTDYNNLAERINSLKTFQGTAAQIKAEVNAIVAEMNGFEAKAKSLQQSQYQATSLASKNLETNQKIQRERFEKLKQDFENTGIEDAGFSTELSKGIEGLLSQDKGVKKAADHISLLRAELQRLVSVNKTLTQQTRKGNTFYNNRLQSVANIKAQVEQSPLLPNGKTRDDAISYVDDVQKKIETLRTSQDAFSTESKAKVDSLVKSLREYVKELENAAQIKPADAADTIAGYNKKQKEQWANYNTNKNTDTPWNRDYLTSLNESENTLANLNQLYNQYQAEQDKSSASARELWSEIQRLNKAYIEQFESVKQAEKGTKADIAAKKQAANIQKKAASAYNELRTFGRNNDRLFGNKDLTDQYNGLADELLALSKNTSATSEDFDKLAKSVAEFKARVTDAGMTGNSFLTKLRSQFEKLGVYFSGAAIWNAINRGTREMISDVIELDTAMTELKKVTDETAGTYNKFLDNASVRAKTLGATLTDVVTATADFARLGYSMDDAANLADAAIIYKNVGDGIEDISDASSSIISTMKAFGIAAGDAMSIVDKFNEVANRFSITASGLGEALVRSASSLSAAGNTLDESIGLIVAANNVLQDPETVGTSLRTIAMRLRNTAGELETLGEDADGAAESVTKLQTQLLNLTGGKVDIMANADTFKSTYAIMQELAGVWNEISDKAKADITRLVAGTRQGNALNAILTNMAEGSKATSTALNSLGSATAENEKYLNSIKGRMAELSAEFETLSKNTVDSDLIKWFVDAGTSILEFANDAGGLIPILTTIATIIGVKNAGNIVSGAEGLINTLSNAADKILGLGDATKSTGNGLIDFGNILFKTEGNLGAWALGVGAATAIIGGLCIYLENEARLERERRKAALENISTFEQLKDSTDSYRERIADLTAQLENENISQEDAYNARKQLLEIQKQIIDGYGKEAGAIDLVTKASNDSKQAMLDAALVKAATQLQAENADQVSEARKNLLTKGTSTVELKNSMPFEQLKNIISKYGDNIYWQGSYWNILGTQDQRINILTDLSNELAQYGDAFQNEREQISKLIKDIKTDDYSDYKDIIESDIINVKAILDDGYKRLYNGINDTIAQYEEAIARNDKEGVASALTSLLDLRDTIQYVADDNLDAQYFQDLIEPFTAAINSNEFDKALKEPTSKVREKIADAFNLIAVDKGTIDDVDLRGLISTYGNVNDIQTISSAGVKTLIDLCDEYSITVDDLVESLTDLGLIEENVQAKEDAAAIAQQKRTDAINTAIDNYNSKIAEANKLFAESSLNPDGTVSTGYYDSLVESGSDLLDVLTRAYDELGNFKGWQIDSSAMDKYISDLTDAAASTLKANDALSEQYAQLVQYVGASGYATTRIAELADKQETLGEAYKKSTQDEQFTLAEMQKLKNEFPQLSFAIDETTGMYKLNGDSALALVDKNFELIKSLSELKLAYVNLANEQKMQDYNGWGKEQTKQVMKSITKFIDDNNIQSLSEYAWLVGKESGRLDNEAYNQFIEGYINARNEIDAAQAEYDTLKEMTPLRWQKEAAEAAAKNSESQFEKLKKQLDLEKSAFENGITLDPQFIQFNLTTMSDYYNKLAKIAKDGYAAQELDAVEYQNYLIEVAQGLGQVDTYSTRTAQLDLEKEALDAKFTLDEEYRKYDIASEKDYWETKLQLAKDAYARGEIDANEYQKTVIAAYTGAREADDKEYSDQLTALNNEKKKIEAGMAWDTSVLTDLSDYYDKFAQINEDRFEKNLITASEYVDSLIEIFKGRNDLLNKTISDFEHDIYLTQQDTTQNGGNAPGLKQRNNAKLLSTYETLQTIVHQAAEEYRASMSGVMSEIEIEHSEYIVNLQKQWWSYQDSINQINEEIFTDSLDAYNDYIKRRNKFAMWGSDNELAAYRRAMRSLKQSYDNDLIDYKRYLTEKLNLLESMYDAEQDRQQAYVNAVVDQLETEKEALEKQLELYEEQRDNYDTTVSTVVSVIDERIKALQEENDELDKQVQLQKALEELELARTQQNKHIYVEGAGFQWMADEKAIKDAQEAYDELRKQTEFNDEIDALEKLKEAWQNTVDSYEKARDEEIAARILGNDWREMLNQQMVEVEKGGSDSLIYIKTLENTKLADFAKQYSDIRDQLDEKVEGSTAFQIKQTEDMITEWNKALDSINKNYEQYEGLLDYVKEFEGANYEERKAMLKSFVDDSVSRLNELRNAVEEADRALSAFNDGGYGVGQTDLVSRMKANSAEWYTADDTRRKELEAENKAIGNVLGWTRDDASGVWYDENGDRAYNLGLDNQKTQQTEADDPLLVNAMKANSAEWHTASPERRKQLEAENESIGEALGWVKDPETGVWYKKNGVRAYGHGGVVDTTGLALLHGKPTQAETVFNASDSAKLYEYVHSVPSLVQDLISRLNMNPNIKKSGDSESSVTIKEIHLHDVQNVDGLADAIVRTLPMKLNQKLNKNR